MLKTLLITMALVLSSAAEAHEPCHTQDVWHPGYWTHDSHRRQIYVNGYWAKETNCPPPPRRQPIIHVRTPPIFPHIRISTRTYTTRDRHHSPRHHSHPRHQRPR